MTFPVNMTIFVVDDDTAVCHSISLILKESGYSVRSFPSAEFFLEEADSRLQGVMLLDQSMPGMTGVELQAELTRRGIVLPIIFMTGHRDERMHAEAFKAGAINALIAPALKASACIRSSLCPVMKIIGRTIPRLVSSACNSTPVIPGILWSSSMTPCNLLSASSRKNSAEGNDLTLYPDSFRMSEIEWHTAVSSSTTKMVMFTGKVMVKDISKQ